MSAAAFDQWCLVELFGHARIAGRVSEQTIGGCAFVRVDVPATPNAEAFTKLYGNSAIYAITPVTEEICRAAAVSYQVTPVQPYDIPELRSLRSQSALPFTPYDEDEPL